MPSPTCEVQDGAGSFTSTTNGKDVTPGNPVTIRLASVAGVSTWSISCITTDETSDAATVTAGLTIDSINKTASFTAPAAGKAYRFQSKINGGLGPDGTVLASYTTTFCIFTLTAASRRVHAVDETFESNATFGWIAGMNDIVRNPPGGVSFTNSAGLASNLSDETGTGVAVFSVSPVLQTPCIWNVGQTQFYQFGVSSIAATRIITLPLLTSGDTFVFEAHTQTLTNKTINGSNNTITNVAISSAVSGLGTGVATFLGTPSSANLASALTDETGSGKVVFDTSPTISSPTLSNTPTLSGASSSTSNNAKGTCVDVNPVNVQTTDATVTTLDSFTIASNSAVAVSWLVTAIKSDSSQGAAYTVFAAFRNNAGTVAQIGATQVTALEDNAAWVATADNSTTTIRLRVTGVAATTIQWTSILTRLTVIP